MIKIDKTKLCSVYLLTQLTLLVSLTREKNELERSARTKGSGKKTQAVVAFLIHLAVPVLLPTTQPSR